MSSARIKAHLQRPAVPSCFLLCISPSLLVLMIGSDSEGRKNNAYNAEVKAGLQLIVPVRPHKFAAPDE